MKNRLGVYTNKVMAEKVRETRKGFGLEEKTHIYVIDDIYAIEPDIYRQMKDIEADPRFSDFRFY